MRDIVNTAPTWTVGAGLSGMYSALYNLDFLGFASFIAISLGILATLYSVYCRHKEHKATMRKLSDEQ